jgi:hypothetical protein
MALKGLITTAAPENVLSLLHVVMLDKEQGCRATAFRGLGLDIIC